MRSSKSTKHHSTIRFNLFSVFALISSIAVVLAIVGNSFHTKRMQELAVANIEEFGGAVFYDHQFDADGSWKFESFGFPVVPRSKDSDWAEGLIYVGLGHELSTFDDVANPHCFSMSYYDGKNADAVDFNKLAYLDEIRFLDTGTRKLNDVDLYQLRKLKNLECLVSNESSGVTDDGLRYLSNLQEIRMLSLDNSQITGQGLFHLAKLGKLERLDLNGSQVSGIGLKHLEGLNKLRVLSLREALVDDRGLVHLANHVQLEKLYLGSTNITDAGLPSLQGLKNLSWLDLTKTDTNFEARSRLETHLMNNPIIH